MPVSRVSCRYPGSRESVHIKLLVSPVRFSHNNVRLLMVYRPYAKFAYRAICRSEIKPVQPESDGQTDGRTDRIVVLLCVCLRLFSHCRLRGDL